MRIRPESPFFVLLLGAMATMPPFATDLVLPALGLVSNTYHVTAGLSGLTIALFMAGFSATPLVYGPLSDRYGRKPVLLVGLGVFAIASVGCALAPSIWVLLLGRLFEGAGAGAGITMALAILRDLFSGEAARARISMVMVVVNLAPVISPSIGAVLLSFMDWRALYGALAVIAGIVVAASLLGYAESRKLEHVAPSGSLLAGYRRLFSNPACVGHFLVYGFAFGAAFAYISGSSLVLIGLYHVSNAVYAALFACTALGIVAGAALNGWLARKNLHHLPLLPLAIAGMVVLTAALTLLSWRMPLGLAVIMPVFALVTFCYGIVAPNASHGALEPIPEIAGVAAGVLASFQMTCATISSAVASLLFTHYGLPAIAAVMLAFAVAAALALQIVPRRGRQVELAA